MATQNAAEATQENTEVPSSENPSTEKELTPPAVVPEKKEVVPPPSEKKEEKVTEQKDQVFDLKLPEKSMLDAAHVDKVVSYAKERGLSKEQAQALLERENSVVSEFANNQKETLKSKSLEWVEEAKRDKELGGETFPQNMEMAKRVVDRFGTDAFKQALNETGLGNHPELLRVFARIGKAMGSDQMILPKNHTTGMKQKPIEEIFYGSNKSQE